MCIKPDKKSSKGASTSSSNGPSAAKDMSEMTDGRENMVTSTHSAHKRNTDYDLLLFLAPALLWKLTPIFPAYLIGIARILSIHLLLTLHYIFIDKDNYNNKISRKQLHRERDDYLVAIILHMWVQIALQMIFPSMFFSDVSGIKDYARSTFWSHVVVVEPLYYAAHRWLHVPEVMKAMHGFHHLSICTTPSTALVQNFVEHFVYIAVFGPAFFIPFLATGHQHWIVIGAYLVIFDLVNAYGHTNIRIRSGIFNHYLSPFKYLFYTPEFHLGHHAYFQANYALFMPMWDKIFGTHREYKKTDVNNLLPPNQQDFVFIGHNGGIGHLLTCPEVSIYNVYDKFRRTFLPISVEFLIMHVIGIFARMFIKSYRLSRYLINGSMIGRVICIPRTPWDFMSPKTYPKMNQEIIDVITDEYKKCGTRYFGLGNLTKMKQLNDGGAVITEMIRSDPYLKDKKIRIWTGDSLTAASIYHQIIEIPNIKEVFYIGASGKVGTAVCSAILKTHPLIKVRIFSQYEALKHPNISYTDNLKDMCNYKVVVVGKFLPHEKYLKALRGSTVETRKTKFILDYTVPFTEINLKSFKGVQHIPIGVLQLTNKVFLKGPFDICMNHDENHIYPCHVGCIINAVTGRETDEVGEVNLDDMEDQWKRALQYGFQNTIINYD